MNLRTLRDSLLTIACGLAVAALVVMLGGCAVQQARQDRFMPRPTIPPVVTQMLVDDCNAAIGARDVPRLIESCSAVTAINCGAWVDTNILAENGIVMRDGTLAAVDAATTIAAGAFSLSPGAVAGVGLAQLVGHLFGQVEKTGLGAPEGFAAQTILFNGLATCTATLSKTVNPTFAQAVIGVDRCRRFCSPGAASAITTQALSGVEVEAAPSGRLMLRRIAP